MPGRRAAGAVVDVLVTGVSGIAAKGTLRTRTSASSRRTDQLLSQAPGPGCSQGLRPGALPAASPKTHPVLREGSSASNRPRCPCCFRGEAASPGFGPCPARRHSRGSRADGRCRAVTLFAVGTRRRRDCGPPLPDAVPSGRAHRWPARVGAGVPVGVATQARRTCGNISALSASSARVRSTSSHSGRPHGSRHEP